ncbi:MULTISPECIES: UDP-N-acetylglucosamine 1-carboxyvinyltransferase [Clostridium]|uniref:UDP-N-acetylglucosamine 1-carboxyvinyltransferase n=1 Tax=Clostridium cadaveris TaxID=1529 RepID=A0A1I2LLT3_9CLOT|nr:UDP-N-acetylglucosamine 1-carboxyvinyltransferase [Clostridium cadaveris]MDU4951404.1 UDP-N-acetylglucosamine 1-carboxyvinyltransferase [Clostridium sp.]MDM8310674.1 UDP-N-acetylglucosamine 1-carboxyvinyltransferase [Clostridium cadaveris]MDY4950687.1 UDP-N-acetylglucosamine 1-carboxyvinyltransferase [Clostridium cadaveris]NME65220.1 UDP-N-acetylglucosamine 1-carboxyvinyltransferase [Clostridium cadaveris]NWK10896.1 UDP-N-acetylglucosamine 1-carboxyvinyltransferase [Clostridium cadaveris]
MEKIIIKGGCKLSGEINLSAAKNAVLPIIAASILPSDTCIIEGAPMLEDVSVLCDVLKSLNADVVINKELEEISIDSKNIFNTDANSELIRKMRASFLIMGPMLSRFGHFRVSLPGGCNIGSRPIDLHLKGFKALGADIYMDHGFVEAKADKLVGSEIYLDFPSVGATENIMMAAVLAEGETILENSAEEPEIKDLANYLISMGADIEGAGTDTIRIRGVKKLKGTKYRPIFDRIEAGTFMIAGAITNSCITINGAEEEYLRPVIAKLTECGVNMDINEKSITIKGYNELKAIDIKTMPYPGFPTDMQAQMIALLCLTPGTSIVTETVFENRFMHAAELKRMGANIKIDGRSAIIEGVPKITGSEVNATDLRAGAALVLAGLAAEGVTEIGDIYHIDRGYVRIEEKLKGLGANIERINK